VARRGAVGLKASGHSFGAAMPADKPEMFEPVDLPPEPAVSARTVASDGTSVLTLENGDIVFDLKFADDPLQDEVEGIGEGFDENLAEKMDDGPLAALAMDLIDGIQSDINSRSEFIGNYTRGLDLLALKIEDRAQGNRRKRTSTIRNPVMLDAVIKFQAAASAELLPASGPCKVRDDAEITEERDMVAAAFERDMNHYLTVTAEEYYPDTDQMLMRLAFGGTAFKKVYRCPLRERPVSESVNLSDLIVSEQATDLANALRITHQLMMPPSNVRRLQLDGFYRDIDLGMPQPNTDEVRRKEAAIHGLATTTTRPQDQDRTLWECYTDVDLVLYGFKEKGAQERLPLPYRVTIDKDSQTVLEVRRNWREGDKKYRKRKRFVKYGMIPGFGFLCLGYLHILGNQTRALTALWRIMIDAGMFANFPGGVKVKGTRQSTNELDPGPGEWVEIDTGPLDDIRKALFPMPYKDLSPVLITLAETISKYAEKLGSSVEFATGEGRTNIPVGTIMAMIEQQTQVMATVHKRLHRAQQEELILLKELFAEDPSALGRAPARVPGDNQQPWTDADEFADVNLVPATDPNVPSQMHRIMLATALVTLASQNPDIYNKMNVHRRALRTIGFGDVDTILQQQPPPPDQNQGDNALQAQDLALKAQELQLKKEEQQRKAASTETETQQRQQELDQKERMQTADRESKERIEQQQVDTEKARLESQRESEHADRREKARQHTAGLAHAAQTTAAQHAHEAKQTATDHLVEAHHKATDRVQASQEKAADRVAQVQQGAGGGRKFGGEEF
jgi:hypothetical protein